MTFTIKPLGDHWVDYAVAYSRSAPHEHTLSKRLNLLIDPDCYDYE